MFHHTDNAFTATNKSCELAENRTLTIMTLLNGRNESNDNKNFFCVRSLRPSISREISS